MHNQMSNVKLLSLTFGRLSLLLLDSPIGMPNRKKLDN